MESVLDTMILSTQAGLLTSGSSLLRAFPSNRQWHYAKLVTGHSGGPVFDSHEVPSLTWSYKGYLLVPELLLSSFSTLN